MIRTPKKPADHRRKVEVNPGEGVAFVNYSDSGASCSCGWTAQHRRAKVLEDRIDRHLHRAHKGLGVRM
jgi:hypothetical protein